MPVKTCRSDGKTGFRWGDSGTCHTYDAATAGAKDGAKKRAIRDAIKSGATRRELESDLDGVGIRLLAEVDEELATEDFEGVEVLAVGGPIRGIGSPPGGEYVTKERLAQIGDDSRELEEEIRPFIKISHSKEQRLLRDSGLTDGEQPSAGRVRNFRLSEDGTRLLADFRKVPKTVAKLVRSGAFTRVSAELKRKLSQDGDGEEHYVVSAVALLGAQLPAVQTVDDIVKLYEDNDERDGPTGDIRFTDDPVFVLASGDVVWDPDEGFEAIRNAVREVLNPGPGSESRYWVRDVATTQALVQEGFGDDSKAWIVPFTRSETGIELAPSTDWTPAEMAWVETARAFAQLAADTRAMPPLTIDEEAQRSLAEKLGVEKVEDLSPEKLLEAVDELKTKAEAEPEPEKPEDEKPEPEKTDLERRLEAAEAKAELAVSTLKGQDKRAFSEAALRAGKIEPGQREQVERYFEADEEGARAFVESLKENEDLAREYGSDEPGTGPGSEASEDERLYAELVVATSREGDPGYEEAVKVLEGQEEAA